MLRSEIAHKLAEIERLEAAHVLNRAAIAGKWRDFGRKIRLKRTLLDLSLAELAGRIGIRKSLLSYLEKGHRKWSVELARKAIDALFR